MKFRKPISDSEMETRLLSFPLDSLMRVKKGGPWISCWKDQLAASSQDISDLGRKFQSVNHGVIPKEVSIEMYKILSSGMRTNLLDLMTSILSTENRGEFPSPFIWNFTKRNFPIDQLINWRCHQADPIQPEDFSVSGEEELQAFIWLVKLQNNQLSQKVITKHLSCRNWDYSDELLKYGFSTTVGASPVSYAREDLRKEVITQNNQGFLLPYYLSARFEDDTLIVDHPVIAAQHGDLKRAIQIKVRGKGESFNSELDALLISLQDICKTIFFAQTDIVIPEVEDQKNVLFAVLRKEDDARLVSSLNPSGLYDSKADKFIIPKDGAFIKISPFFDVPNVTFFRMGYCRNELDHVSVNDFGKQGIVLNQIFKVDPLHKDKWLNNAKEFKIKKVRSLGCSFTLESESREVDLSKTPLVDKKSKPRFAAIHQKVTIKEVL